MIDQQRNQRFWQACGKGTGFGLTLDNLNDIALPAVREKLELDSVGFDFLKDGRVFCMLHVGKGGISAYGETIKEALFNACEKALLTPQDSQQAG